MVMKKRAYQDVIAGLDVIIDEFKKTGQFTYDETDWHKDVYDDEIEVLEWARNFLFNTIETAESTGDEERHPISKEMDECVSDFMETISELKK